MANQSAYKELVQKQLKEILDLVIKNVLSNWEESSDIQMESPLLPNEGKPAKRKFEVCHSNTKNKKFPKVD